MTTPNQTVERIMEMAYQAAEAQADWAMNLASDKLHTRATEKDEALRTKIAAMVEALEFYAGHNNWDDEGGVASRVDYDEGDRARSVLAEIRGAS